MSELSDQQLANHDDAVYAFHLEAGANAPVRCLDSATGNLISRIQYVMGVDLPTIQNNAEGRAFLQALSDAHGLRQYNETELKAWNGQRHSGSFIEGWYDFRINVNNSMSDLESDESLNERLVYVLGRPLTASERLDPDRVASDLKMRRRTSVMAFDAR